MGAISNYYIDVPRVKEALSILKPNNELYEIRIIKGREVLSGYFVDHDVAIAELLKLNLDGANVYITLHKIHPGCAARLQYNTFMNTSKVKIPTTSDNDVLSYKYIPIDLDPVRPTGISSSIEELEAANDLRKQVEAYMCAQGFIARICGFSGNGYHLLYPYEHKADASGEEYVKKILWRLDEVLSNEQCHVDVTNHNPARIFKLYGTRAQKGRNTEDRPHRMSRIMEVGDRA